MHLDRMIGILSILLQQERVTAPYLAEKFEVSRRTIDRDIDALCMAGIPLVTTRGVNGGISIMEGYRIDRTLLTSSDMRAILTGLRSLDSCSGANRYAQLMEKLSAGSSELLTGDEHILINLASWSRERLSPKLELLHGAIDNRRLVTFSYSGPCGDSRRTIEPYYLLFQWSNWYVWSWCTARKDFRLFKLWRMTEPELGDPFTPRPAPLPDLSDNTVFPPLVHAQAVVQPSQRWRLLEEFGPESFTVQEDGRLLFSGSFTDGDTVLRWIASFGGDAELLEPKDLRTAMARFAEKLLSLHSET